MKNFVLATLAICLAAPQSHADGRTVRVASKEDTETTLLAVVIKMPDPPFAAAAVPVTFVPM